MLRFACSLALTVGWTLAALADIPPPPPSKGFKRVPYEIAMKLEKEIPGHKFYTYGRYGIGGEGKVAELKLGTENAVTVPSSSSASVRTGVIAVSDKAMAELKTTENLAKLFSRDMKDDVPAGVVFYDTNGTTTDLKEGDPRTKVVSVVTISPDEKTGVKFTVKEAPVPEPPAPKSGNDGSIEGGVTTPSTQLPGAMMIAGVAAALAVVTLGLWLFRRK